MGEGRRGSGEDRMGGKEKSGRVEGNRDIRERIDERGRGREGNEVIRQEAEVDKGKGRQ